MSRMPIDRILLNSRILSADLELKPLSVFLADMKPTKVALITDSHLFKLHGEAAFDIIKKSCPVPLSLILPAGEASKNLQQVEQCWNKMHSYGLDRNSLVIGLGGGVITDLAGFVASCYMRGISYLSIPTSLMGMVDAAIGGKTAVNLETGKNLIGTFSQPKMVLIAPRFLETLPQRELFSGIAEMIKCAAIRDSEFYHYLEKNLAEIVRKGPGAMEYLIEKTASIKIEIVSQDEKEHGLRALLNWGHTVAHALETLTHYETYLHGEAVAIGMCCEAYVGRELGLAGTDFIGSLEALCGQVNLPTRLPPGTDLDRLIDLMTGDKKALGGHINMVLIKKIGEADKVDNIDKALIKKALMRQAASMPPKRVSKNL